MTRKQKVLRELIDAYQGKKYEYNYSNWISGGWCPRNALDLPSVGGAEATKRLRESRDGGIDIIWDFYFVKDPEGDYLRSPYENRQNNRVYRFIKADLYPESGITNLYRKTSTTIYKLLTDPKLIDIENCKLREVKNGQQSLFQETANQ